MSRLDREGQPSASFQSRLCFILGIHLRSGTNYIYNLLKEHPDCAGPGPIWEDHVLQYSRPLIDYTASLYRAWNPKWKVAEKIGSKGTLLGHFGDSIQAFLLRQLNDGDPRKVLLTKTPSVKGLGSFFDLFPDAHLILIVRDGRALVESGVRSFDWRYENAMQAWREGAQEILDFQRACQGSERKMLLVKYEDLVQNTRNELCRMFEFLDLDPERYDFAAAESLGVIGSSESKGQEGSVHWRVTEKTAEFNPLARAMHWDRKKHERFNWVAGRPMVELGYTLDETVGSAPVRNRLLDAGWKLRSLVAALYRAVR